MAWKTLCNEMQFLTENPVVGLAISDSPSPTPGYMFGQINAITYLEYGVNCKPLVNFLVSRLDQSTPHVCMKILKLLLYLVKNGHTEMIEEVKYHESPLKEATRFHGPPDDLHGKSFYETIRTMSKELLQYVFAEPADRNENIAPSSQVELTGYGSGSTSGTSTGFGYSMKTQKSLSDVVTEGVTSVVEKFFPSESKVEQVEIPRIGDSLPKFKPLLIDKSTLDFEVVDSEASTSSDLPPIIPRPKQRVHKPGRAGGGWDDSEDEEDNYEVTIPDEKIAEVCDESAASADSLEFNKLELKERSSDWVDEQEIVHEFTVNDPLHKLENSNILGICKRCSTLNCDKILIFILERINEEEENVKLRCLLLIEYLIFHDILSLDSLTALVLPSLTALCEESEGLPPSVKTKSLKICLIIQKMSKCSLQKTAEQNCEKMIECES